jgi:cytochrome c
LPIRLLTLSSALASGFAMLAATPIVSAAERGMALFEPCRACHALDPKAEAKPGPNLSGLIGRRIAGDPSFDYSPVLRDAGKSGAVWTHERLDAFLADPEAMLPGMWMTAQPMREAANRKALADFLADPKSR